MEHPLFLRIKYILNMVDHEKKEHSVNSSAYKTNQEVIKYFTGLKHLLVTQTSSQNTILEYVTEYGDISHFMNSIQCHSLNRETEYTEKRARFKCLLLDILMFLDIEFNPSVSDDPENDCSWFLLQSRILRIKIV